MTWRVIVGTLSLMLTMILFGYVAVTEQDRMTNFNAAYESRQVEIGAALFEQYCARCHGPEGTGIEGFAPGLNSPDLFNGTRLKQIGWVGATEDFVRTTIAGGRPRASAAFANYPQRMPTWSTEFGGPLRKDQVDALVTFIMNWGEAYKDASGNYIASVTPTPVADAVGTDITAALPAGDASRGGLLVQAGGGGKGCVACHVGASAGVIAPAWLADEATDGKSVAAHAAERFQDPAYTGAAASPEQYLLESIVQPSAYLVPGVATYSVNGVSVMPATFSTGLSRQDVADIIAYLLTLK